VDVVGRLRAAGCVFAEDEAALLTAAARTPAELEALVARRVEGEPLEYILGFVEFCGRRIAVQPGVFVPRQRTELVVRTAIAVTRPGSILVDLCCGCGAIGAVLADRYDVYAADVDPAAVACARANLPAERVFQGDLYAALPLTLHGHIATIAANVPYVPTDEIANMPPEARDHEPRRTLDGGADGLDILRRVAASAGDWLIPGGHLIIETSDEQAPAAVAAFEESGLTAEIVTDDEIGATVISGATPAP